MNFSPLYRKYERMSKDAYTNDGESSSRNIREKF